MNQHNDEQTIMIDYRGRVIRLSEERRIHILEHPEMADQFDWIKETIASPDFIIATLVDPAVHVYPRFYPQTPVTRKYLLIAVKIGKLQKLHASANTNVKYRRIISKIIGTYNRAATIIHFLHDFRYFQSRKSVHWCCGAAKLCR